MKTLRLVALMLLLDVILAACPEIGSSKIPPLERGGRYQSDLIDGACFGTVQEIGPGSWVRVRQGSASNSDEWVNMDLCTGFYRTDN